MISTSARGPLLVAALALLWGTNFALIKVSLDAFTPTQVTFGRMALGAAFLVGVVLARREPWPRGRVVWGHLVVAALVANTLPYFLFAYGETRVDSSIAGVANSTTPLWTLALVVVLRQREPVTARRVAGFVVGLLGCAVLFTPWDAGGVDIVGALACVLAALCYAVGFVYMARFLTPRGLSPVALAGAQLVAATGWSALALLPDGGPAPAFDARAWLSLLALGVLGTGVAYVVSYALIRSSGAIGVSVVTYLFPLISVAIGAAWLGEDLTAPILVGTAVILVGVALSTRPAERAAARVAPPS